MVLKILWHYKWTWFASVLVLAFVGLSSTALVVIAGPVIKFLFTLGQTATTNLAHLLPNHLQSFIPSDLQPLLTTTRSTLLLVIPVTMVVIALIKNVGVYLQQYLMGRMGLAIGRDLRNYAFARILQSKIQFFDTTKTGVLISTIINDTQVIQTTITKTAQQFLTHTILTLSYLATMFIIDWKLTAWCLLILPPIGLIIQFSSSRIEGYAGEVQKQLGSVIASLAETISGFRLIKAYCAESVDAKKFARHNAMLYESCLKTIRIRTLFAPLMDFIALALFALAILYCRSQLQHQQSDPAGLFSFLALCGSLFRPINMLSTNWISIKESLGATKRVRALIAHKDSIESTEGIAHEGPFSTLRYENVSLTLAGSPVLKNINLSISGGQRIAFVGHSGAGKSCLVKLLLRFYDDTQALQNITIDATPIANIRIASLRQHIAYVSQTPFLFKASIRDNIAYGCNHSTEGEIREVAAIAEASAFIDALPMGYDYVISPDANNLSGGQKQRLSLARALLCKRPILILDEFTSALDVETEARIVNNLNDYVRRHKMTTIIIAHRPSTLKGVDMIHVVSDGHIHASGNHKQLLEESRLFRQLLAQES